MNSRTTRTVAAAVVVGMCAGAIAAPITKTVGVSPNPQVRKLAAPLLSKETEKTFAVKSGTLKVSTHKNLAKAGKRKIVFVGCTAVNDAVLKKFVLKDSKITGVYPDSNVVTVAVGSDEDLQTIASIPEVVRIRPAHKGRSNVGIAESQGVKAHRVDSVRAARYLDGASQKVGILSDSFAYGPPVRGEDTEPPPNTPGILRNSVPQEAGELPREVELLADDANVYWPGWTPGDEGEAMAELIHDIAPGAKLAFHTAEPDFMRMAQGILALRSAGCTIITDDYTYYDEPWFMESPVSTAIASVIRSGAAYFTCAGNSGDSGIRLVYRDANPSVTDNESWPATDADLALWDSGYGPYLPITFTPPESHVTLVLQWNQPWETFAPSTGGAQVDLDLYLLSDPAPPNEALFWFASADSQGQPGEPGGDPIEILDIYYSGTGPFTVYVAVDHFWGPQNRIPQNRRAPVEFWLWAYRADEGGVITPLLGPVTTGHQTASGVGCVGAVRFEEAPAYDPTSHGPTSLIDPEWFTARGGSIQIPFDANGRYRPRVATVPNIAAVDGCDTLFFGVDYDDGTPFPNFFGTSAAAPNAAAVAALLRQADSKLKPADVMKILSQTAVDVTGERAAAGFDAVTGAGLIDASAAIGKVRKGENLAIVPAEATDVIPTLKGNNDQQGAKSSKLIIPNYYRPLRLSNSPEFVPFPERLFSGQPVYAWFSVANTGTSEAGKASRADILVDGTVVASFAVPPLYGPSIYSFSAVELPPFSEGQHVVEVRADATNRIRELNEADNSYFLNVTVLSEAE